MRFLLNTLLILAYGVLVMRPSMPMVEYELRKDFIASEYCVNQDEPEMKCDGKCYLNKRLAEAGQENPNPVETQIAPSLPVHITSQCIEWVQTPANSTFELEFDHPLHSHFSPPPSPPPEYKV